MNPITEAAFIDEFEKISDIVLTHGPKDKARVTAGGIFVGGVPNDQHEKHTQELMGLLQQHGSLMKARDAYEKAHPEYYVTTAIRQDAPPSGLRHAVGKLFSTEGYRERERGWKARSTGDPRLFIHLSSEAGGPDQTEFYRDVARGLHSHEHDLLSKKERQSFDSLFGGRRTERTPVMKTFEPAKIKAAGLMGTVDQPGVLRRAAGWLHRVEDPIEVAGLGILAAPNIDSMIAKHRARKAGLVDEAGHPTEAGIESKRFIKEKWHDPIEAGGLGILAAPLIGKRISTGRWTGH